VKKVKCYISSAIYCCLDIRLLERKVEFYGD
jgi:hypothetical protein